VVQPDRLGVAAPPRRWLEGGLRRFEPAKLLWLGVVAALVFLVANPMLRLVVASFQATEGGAASLENYVIAYGNLRSLTALLNSLVYGTAVTLLAIVFAVPIAWAVSRTDMPGKGFVRAMILGAFITPSYLGAIGWILLAGPNAGRLNKVWMALTGAEHGIFNVYSMAGLIVVVAVTSFPYVFVFTSSALDLVSLCGFDSLADSRRLLRCISQRGSRSGGLRACAPVARHRGAVGSARRRSRLRYHPSHRLRFSAWLVPFRCSSRSRPRRANRIPAALPACS